MLECASVRKRDVAAKRAEADAAMLTRMHAYMLTYKRVPYRMYMNVDQCGSAMWPPKKPRRTRPRRLRRRLLYGSRSACSKRPKRFFLFGVFVCGWTSRRGSRDAYSNGPKIFFLVFFVVCVWTLRQQECLLYKAQAMLCTCMCVCVYIGMCVCVCVCVYVNICIYIYICI